MTTVPSPRQIRRAHTGQGRGLQLVRAHAHDVAGRAYPGLRQRPARTRLRQRTNTTPRDFSDLTFLANSATASLRYRAVDDDGLRVPASFARPWTRTRRRPPPPASIPRPDMYAHWPPGAPRASSPASSRRVSDGSLIAAALLADPFICSPTRCCCAATASGHGPRRDHRWPHRPGHGDGRAARHGRRRHHGRAGVHGGRRVAVALRRAGNLERRLRGRWRAHAFISQAGPPRTHFLPSLVLWFSFFLARCHLELAHRPPCAREGGPRRAQRRREPGACVRAHHTVTESPHI